MTATHEDMRVWAEYEDVDGNGHRVLVGILRKDNTDIFTIAPMMDKLMQCHRHNSGLCTRPNGD